MALLSGLRVVQLGPGLAAAVCGRLFADIGAAVGVIDADSSTPLAAHLNSGKKPVGREALREADLIVCEGGAARRCARGNAIPRRCARSTRTRRSC